VNKETDIVDQTVNILHARALETQTKPVCFEEPSRPQHTSQSTCCFKSIKVFFFFFEYI